MIRKFRIACIVVLTALLLAAAVWGVHHFSSLERTKGQTYVVAYQTSSGLPCPVDDSTYIVFSSNRSATLYHQGSVYTIRSFKAANGVFSAKVTYAKYAGGVKTHLDTKLTGTIHDGVLLFDPEWRFAVDLTNYVFVEESRLKTDREKAKPPIDGTSLDEALVGLWANFDSFEFREDGTGVWVKNMVPGDSYPLTWTAHDGILEVSFTEYLPPQITKKYDFVDAADGYFLRLYDLDQDPTVEPFLSELFRKKA